MDERYHLALTSPIPVRWGDMDAMGHVNNTVYFRYMEQARIEWIESLGYACDPTVQSFVIVNASCTFIRPVTYPAIVEVRTFIGPAGRSSVPTRYELRCEGDDVLYAEGASKLVWMRPDTGRSAPLPDAIRNHIERILQC